MARLFDEDELPEDEYPGQLELSPPLPDCDVVVDCELALRAVAFSALARAAACSLGPSTGSWPAAICSEMPAVSSTKAALAITVIRATVELSFLLRRLVRLG